MASLYLSCFYATRHSTFLVPGAVPDALVSVIEAHLLAEPDLKLQDVCPR